MDCCDGQSFRMADDEAAEPPAMPPGRPAQGATETELQFFTRRAMEESRLAKQAGTPQAAAAHSYLAAAYSAEVAKELARQDELEKLLLQLD